MDVVAIPTQLFHLTQTERMPSSAPPLLDPKTPTTPGVRGSERHSRKLDQKERESSVTAVENSVKTGRVNTLGGPRQHHQYLGRGPESKRSGRQPPSSINTMCAGGCPKASTCLPHGRPAGDVVSVWTDRCGRVYVHAQTQTQQRPVPEQNQEGCVVCPPVCTHSLTSMYPRAPMLTSSPKPQGILRREGSFLQIFFGSRISHSNNPKTH